ncbi:hypothetical protein CONLIGDRAFT_269442 [Coniochaeta ligniaria NRRL 30616]|uniref:Uncharacterized protein n=1 Tax=Coniochaeta ligniaria NRRL 30616 TaxID=1408157 RepID=A0A1J7JGE2_9PEZI|nr:hypothetical protein CONLIGDRAFT_269442 [Coniochaeta ligniaria NRRL 30616]
MSVFSMIKRGRQAAKEHAAKQAEKQAAEAAKAPYKHVPRHAASDALSSGPSSHREDDRPKIMEQNRRRSMMTASGLGMSGTSTPVHVGFPRVNSALSHVSYPAAYASPVVQVPRAYSYSSVQPGWSNYGGEVVYTPMESSGGSVKGKEVERTMVDSGRASRTSSKGSFGPYPVQRSAPSGPSGNSPVDSSSNSTSSQDDLEMKPAKHGSTAPAARSPGSGSNSPSHVRPAGEVDYFHRLHPSNPRRISDPSTAKQYMSQPRSSYVPQKQGGPRVASLPPAASTIPPVPALPAMHFGAPLTQPTISSPGSNASIAGSYTTAASSITMVPYPTSRGSPPRLPVPEEVAGPVPAKEFDTYLPEVGTAVTAPPPAARRESRRASKTARFTELEPVISNVSDAYARDVSAVPLKPEVRTTITATYALPTQFDESALTASQPPVMPSQQKKAKLSKTPTAKLAKNDVVKKNRWSFRSSKATPVAV